jgi:tetratricopeptide (TPR) repeat protein
MRYCIFLVSLFLSAAAWCQPDEEAKMTSMPRPEWDRTGSGSTNVAWGKAILESGGPPPSGTRVDLTCDGLVRSAGSTNSDGSFKLAAVAGEASVGWLGVSSKPWGQDCRLHFRLAGYRSVSSPNRAGFWHSELGLIVLRRAPDTVEPATPTPPEAETAYNKGSDALRKRNWKEARKQMGKAVELHPAYPAAWYGLGIAEDELGQPKEAQKSLLRSLAENPGFADPYFRLAAIAAREGNSLNAAAYLRDYVRLAPQSKDAETARRLLARIEAQ